MVMGEAASHLVRCTRGPQHKAGKGHGYETSMAIACPSSSPLCWIAAQEHC
ncbi:hypothetical protein DAI22_10g054000 [Oryza sativa Japonica Group]|nr:hypothetical protein DAI22_10g054000 [Oryza sativa Japonica Group]